MADSNLDILIQARDEATGILQRLNREIGNLGTTAQGSHGPIGLLTNGIGGLTSILGKVGLAGLGIKTVVDGVGGLLSPIGDAISLASDLNENTNKVDVVFGEAAGSIKEFGRTAAQSMGLSKSEALGMAGTFGNLFSALGLSEVASADLSKQILTLGSDLSSFNNIPTADALEKLRAGLVGESEPLRSLGVNLTEAAVADKALVMGLAKTKGELSEAAKVQARYALILEQTKNAQGDFVRTSTGMANAQRIIGASFADLKTTIGETFLPVLAPLVSNFAQVLPRAMEALKPSLDWFKGVMTGLADVIAGKQDLGAWFSKTMGDVKTAIDTAFPVIQAQLGKWGQALVDWIGKNAEPMFKEFAILVARLYLWIQAQAPGWLKQLQAWGDALWKWIEPMIPPMLEKLGALVTRLGGWVQEQTPAVLKLLQGWGESFWKWVEPIIPPLLAEVGKLLERLGMWISDTAFPALAIQLATWAIAFWAWVQDAAPKLLEELNTLAGELGKWFLTTAFPMISKQLAQWAVAFVKWVGPAALDLLTELGKLEVQFTAWFVTKALPAIVKQLLEWRNAFWSWVGPATLELLGELGKLLLKIGGWMKDTAIPELAKKAGEIGSAVANGIIGGIGDIAGRLGQILGDAAAAALEAVKKKLGIASPSKEFFFVGQMMVTGMINGISSLEQDLAATLTGLLWNNMPSNAAISEWAKGIGFPEWVGKVFAKERGKLPTNLKEFEDFLDQKGWRNNLPANEPESPYARLSDAGARFSGALSSVVTALDGAMKKIVGSFDPAQLTAGASAAEGLGKALISIYGEGKFTFMQDALARAGKILNDNAAARGMIGQIQQIVLGFESMGATLPADLAFGITEIAEALGGPMKESILKFLELAPQRAAMAKLTGFIEEFDLGQKLVSTVKTMADAGLEIPKELKDILAQVPRAAGSYLDTVINNILGLASGTMNWRGGVALVGERGPELVNLPRGAQVFNAQDTKQGMGNTYYYSPTFITPTAPSPTIEFALMRAMDG